MTPDTKVISKLWWFWVPVIIFGIQIGIEIFLPRSIRAPLHNENGPHEVLQALVVFIAFIISLAALYASFVRRQIWLAMWCFLASLCSLYVAGEEVSWGQHLFDWSTPEFWQRINDQKETNFHNTSSWFDQKPKLLLQIGVYAGGLVAPFLMARRPGLLPARFNIIYPPVVTGVTAFFALVIMIQHKIAQGYEPFIFFTRANEVQELYLYYFVALYMWILRCRILQH